MEREKKKITDNVHEMYLFMEKDNCSLIFEINPGRIRTFIYLMTEKKTLNYSKEIKLNVVVFRGDGERLGRKIFGESNSFFLYIGGSRTKI